MRLNKTVSEAAFSDGVTASHLTGYEPRIGGNPPRLPITGLEPTLGGDRRFDPHIWARLIDPRSASKETLTAEMPLPLCTLYARFLVKVLEPGFTFREPLEDDSMLGSRFAPEQRASIAHSLGLIGARAGFPLAASIADALIVCLSPAEDEVVRTEVARALGLLGDIRAEASLLEGLGSGGWRFRLAAIHALGLVGGADALEFLMQFQVHCESLNESTAAMEALGVLGRRLGDPHQAAVFELLAHMLVRGDYLQRGAAARALGMLGNRDALDLIIQVALHGRGDLQCAAVQALGLLGDAQAVPPLIGVLTSGAYHARQDAVNSLIQIGQAAILPVLTILRHPEPAVRQGAVDVLGKVGAREAGRALIERMNDSSPDVRRSAVAAVGMLGGDGAVAALLGSLEDPDPDVRKETAMTLGSFSDERIVGPLCLALWDPDMTVRWFAAYSLGVIKDARSVRPLCQALADRSENVSRTAADALVKIGDVAVSALAEFAQNGDGGFRHLALDVISQIGSPVACEAIAGLTQPHLSALGRPVDVDGA